MPRTLVHGDFVAKNIGVRPDDGRVVLLPFDWGQAGWGPPAVDLGASPPDLGGLTADVDVTGYWEVVRGHWPGVDRAAVHEWVSVGTLVRCVMAVAWEAASLRTAYVMESVARIGWYGDALGEVLEAGELA
jgi:aminoglycoside phosphotransferase (APT) family kinase protein